MTLQNPFIDFDCAITINGNKEVNCRQEAIATIKNNGTFFNNQLYLLVDGNVMGGRFFEIAPDGSAELDMSFIPRETGEKEIAFAYKETYYDEGQKLWVDNYQEIGKTTVTFNAAKTNELKISNGMVLNADAIGNINSNVAKLRFEARNAKTTSEYYDNICVRVQRSYGCISANWLMHGEGEMLVVEEPTEQGDANGTLAAKNETIATLKAQLKDKDALLADKDGRIADKQALIDNLQEQVADLRRQLAAYRSKELMGDLPFKLGKVGEGDLPSAGE
jgi:hypothetical protein